MLLNSTETLNNTVDAKKITVPTYYGKDNSPGLGIELTLQSIYYCLPGEVIKNSSKIPPLRACNTYKRDDGRVVYNLDSGSYIVYFDQGINLPKKVVASITPNANLVRAGGNLRFDYFDPLTSLTNVYALLIASQPITLEAGVKIGRLVMEMLSSSKGKENE
jgi:deoxycytidine triphosphate deaminase